MLLQVEALTDKLSDEIQSSFHSEHAGVDAQVVALRCSPRLARIVILIGSAFLLLLADIFPSAGPVKSVSFADTLQSLIDVR